MDFWQGIFLNLAIIGLISQVVHIFIIFFKSLSMSRKLNDKFLLEKIYNKPYFSEHYFKNAKF